MPPELYAPGKVAYEMLNGAVVRRPNLVFYRNHEAGKRRIHLHKFQDGEVCQKVLGYYANALYLSTMLGTMPCGKEVIVHRLQTSGNIK